MAVAAIGAGFFQRSIIDGSPSSANFFGLATGFGAVRVLGAGVEGNVVGLAALGKITELQCPHRIRPPESVSAGATRCLHNGQSNSFTVGLDARGLANSIGRGEGRVGAAG